MKAKFKRPLMLLLCVAIAGIVFSVCYVRTHPLVFNESFWEHAHCIANAGLSLTEYAQEHFGHFPFHTNGYGDALVMINDGWDAPFTGPGYDTKVFERVRRTGEDAPENEFGRVYVQGLSINDNARIAILFDKLPTPGGDHCHFLRRLTAQLGREVWTIGNGIKFIPESDWEKYSKEQIELLVAAGIASDQAKIYYSQKPKQ